MGQVQTAGRITHQQLRQARRWAGEQGFPLLATFAVAELPADLGRIIQPALPPRGGFPSLFLIGGVGGKAWSHAMENALGNASAGEPPLDVHSASIAEHILRHIWGVASFARLYPGAQPVPLQRLGELAGWHHPSPLGLGIHHQYGPWSAYRALYAVGESLPATANISSASPCDHCQSRACESHCPVGAVRFGQAFAVRTCIDQRLAPASPCASKCPARQACPVGTEHRYNDRQMAYHYQYSLATLQPPRAPDQQKP